MKIAFVMLAAAFALLLIEYIRYRRQIAEICRQAEFHHNESTNIEMCVSMNRREIVELRDRLNDLFADGVKIRAECIEREARTKELIADVSHDIRTPLTSMSGYFSLLMAAESPEARGKYADIITTRIKILGDLLEQLFTYAKLQNDAYKLEIDSFDCAQTTCEVVLSFYEEFRAEGIRPEIDIPDGKCMIFGNRTAFVRIVQNIIRNALIHGSADDGRPKIGISLAQTDSCVKITFVNSLCGNWDGDIDRVFERFYTADKARSARSTGLGMPVAKKLAEAMHGKISARLEQGDFVTELEFPA